ncbi:Nucleobase-ascorbate transporter 6 [Dendrobium catenatum]|uniref:Nucleobase-ascorbate transporter 6 n=1 Tax=Dendrobium catenatum TaxID=906689 RepID=A0A2I0WM83_9ASPA|nr:Nucleobase-ascorbate transporter 6 [Dendrobium catenatum]
MNCHVMSTNSGYYVAAVTCSGGGGAETPVKYATLLQPDDSLHISQDYRLVSFEEVLRELGSKKRVRLSRIIQRRKEREERKTREGGADEVGNSSPEMSNDIIDVIFSSPATVAAMVAYFLDNTILRTNAETRKDRGWQWWDKFRSFKTDTRSEEVYTLPFNLNKFFPSV